MVKMFSEECAIRHGCHAGAWVLRGKEDGRRKRRLGCPEFTDAVGCVGKRTGMRRVWSSSVRG